MFPNKFGRGQSVVQPSRQRTSGPTPMDSQKADDVNGEWPDEEFDNSDEEYEEPGKEEQDDDDDDAHNYEDPEDNEGEEYEKPGKEEQDDDDDDEHNYEDPEEPDDPHQSSIPRQGQDTPQSPKASWAQQEEEEDEDYEVPIDEELELQAHRVNPQSFHRAAAKESTYNARGAERRCDEEDDGQNYEKPTDEDAIQPHTPYGRPQSSQKPAKEFGHSTYAAQPEAEEDDDQDYDDPPEENPNGDTDDDYVQPGASLEPNDHDYDKPDEEDPPEYELPPKSPDNNSPSVVPARTCDDGVYADERRSFIVQQRPVPSAPLAESFRLNLHTKDQESDRDYVTPIADSPTKSDDRTSVAPLSKEQKAGPKRGNSAPPFSKTQSNCNKNFRSLSGPHCPVTYPARPHSVLAHVGARAQHPGAHATEKECLPRHVMRPPSSPIPPAIHNFGQMSLQHNGQQPQHQQQQQQHQHGARVHHPLHLGRSASTQPPPPKSPSPLAPLGKQHQRQKSASIPPMAAGRPFNNRSPQKPAPFPPSRPAGFHEQLSPGGGGGGGRLHLHHTHGKPPSSPLRRQNNVHLEDAESFADRGAECELKRSPPVPLAPVSRSDAVRHLEKLDVHARPMVPLSPRPLLSSREGSSEAVTPPSSASASSVYPTLPYRPSLSLPTAAHPRSPLPSPSFLSNQTFSMLTQKSEDSTGSPEKDLRYPYQTHESQLCRHPSDMEIYSKIWYASRFDRRKAEDILRASNLDGAFMVRRSSGHQQNQPYTLVVYFKRTVFNIQIRYVEAEQKYALGMEKAGEERFNSVPEMIEHYELMPLTLIGNQQTVRGSTRLLYPISS
uniref:Lymphocyte cytosolic protein 2-like n=1 Tax=Petromyzon marinus TaxID=7757 RepID=A0AAJ7TII8_PETMA|nr:lymphocyte cytosolic protein 2-like [Petromyzon marinus]